MSVKVTYRGTLDTYKFFLKTGISYDKAVKSLSIQTGCPKKSIVLYHSPDRLLEDGKLANKLVKVNESDVVYCNMIMKIRPLLGDHSHIIHSFWVMTDGYKLISPLVDIYPITTNVSADVHEVGTYYIANGINNGAHTHGDGLIHVHPFTSPTSTVELTEGLNSTLRLYFPVVGITYRTVADLPSLQFNSRINLINKESVTDKSGYTYIPVGNTPSTRFDPTEALMWYLFIWQSNKEFVSKRAPKMYTQNFTNVWLGMYEDGAENFKHEGHEDTMVFIFVYGPKGLTSLPKELRSSIYKVTLGQIEEFARNH